MVFDFMVFNIKKEKYIASLNNQKTKIMSQLISKQEANQEIGLYIQNKKDATAAFAGIAAPLSNKYFTTAPHSQVFEASKIKELLDLNPTANGIKVYNASLADGTPTIVLVACNIEISRNTVTNLVASKESAALQMADRHIVNTTNFDVSTDNG